MLVPLKERESGGEGCTYTLSSSTSWWHFCMHTIFIVRHQIGCSDICCAVSICDRSAGVNFVPSHDIFSRLFHNCTSCCVEPHRKLAKDIDAVTSGECSFLSIDIAMHSHWHELFSEPWENTKKMKPARHIFYLCATSCRCVLLSPNLCKAPILPDRRHHLSMSSDIPKISPVAVWNK